MQDIFVIPSGGGPVRQLTTHSGGDTIPIWSPDGERIVCASRRDGNDDIWVMSATGDDQRRLTDYAGSDIWPAWSPDGRWIAFESGRGGETQLWRMGAYGGEPERLTNRYGYRPQWARDDETVYFRGRRARNEYWAITLEARTERLVADLSGKPGIQGQYATDGEYLYFTWEETLGDIRVMDVVWDE